MCASAAPRLSWGTKKACEAGEMQMHMVQRNASYISSHRGVDCKACASVRDHLSIHDGLADNSPVAFAC